MLACTGWEFLFDGQCQILNNAALVISIAITLVILWYQLRLDKKFKELQRVYQLRTILLNLKDDFRQGGKLVPDESHRIEYHDKLQGYKRKFNDNSVDELIESAKHSISTSANTPHDHSVCQTCPKLVSQIDELLIKNPHPFLES
jgi:hypothetical protein